ncbi:hypothetical protein D7X55_20020 [Corallococcus sp. AB049A]|uniref:Uncharacterized protein n=1 Tax=Corallococcus interemptor TaxID=2316720 RepID=A0A3A8QU22_9BACT|nr:MULTISPECIES: hypothetical protein [Corallococcus]RKH53034.1 hypothetical protein D7Y23_04985 [Corallococcus sp. AB050B]RKH72047.1 hypothetical protein D7X96_06385 [Corallococcus interemptor]RKI63487.1 hypothetical protein D7X55_20020 [Corallococcus sp. AB049A]
MRTLPSKRMSLLTEREAQLVLSSAPRNLAELSPRELRGRIQRTRRLMEKYQDAAQRQRREALRKTAPSRSRRAEGNRNTLQKAQYFALTLERFEKRLALLERKEQVRTRAASRPASRRTTRVATGGRKPARRPRAAGRTAKAPGQRKSRQKQGGALKQERFPSLKRQVAASTRGRRTQGRRDARR